MKKENVLAVAVIGAMFAGLILVAFGNPLGFAGFLPIFLMAQQ
jgi:hypothetical protein